MLSRSVGLAVSGASNSTSVDAAPGEGSSPPSATKSSVVTRAKWLLFRLLETAVERCSRRAARPAHPRVRRGPVGCADPPLWVYVSTIGELNAIEPFLRRLLSQMDAPPLVLLTDRPFYREIFQTSYPQAAVRIVDHLSQTALALIAEGAPRLLIVAETPCLPSDAPCRFGFALPYLLKRRGIPVCLINGWLYRGSPSCIMDAIEKRLFGREYGHLFDFVAVQDDRTRTALIAAGVDPERVFVTGNIKFDRSAESRWTPAHGRSPVLLQSIADSGRPVVVAGCVTNLAEQVIALDAFCTVKREMPDALLVLAPRHPEVRERMTKLLSLLAERRLSHARRSKMEDVALPAGLDCLVLDTMGELKDFYSVCNIAYVGLNHNVLEPLAYGKPVVVTCGWEPSYPSFPVYQTLLARDAIEQVDDAALGAAWLALIRNPLEYAIRKERIGKALESLKGAAALNLELLARFGLLRTAGPRPQKQAAARRVEPAARAHPIALLSDSDFTGHA